MTAILDVPLEDYLALHAERDKLKEEKKRLLEALKEALDGWDDHGRMINGTTWKWAPSAARIADLYKEFQLCRCLDCRTGGEIG